MNTDKSPIRLTQYSHGAGCGCKISPAVLEEILSHSGSQSHFDALLVGNNTKDDAAVMALDDQYAIVSTTDFFMPIVDDAHDFGAIAATNALSDIYAMGARPLMAIAILGWPISKLPEELAGQVIAGGRAVCEAAGIPLAGGHSIDAPEPIFGLAVTGVVAPEQVKKNKGAQVGDFLYLTKAIGVGMVTTAEKKGIAMADELAMARASMLQLNDIGSTLAKMDEVHAMTDVTGFGLAGHLVEMCEASGCAAELDYSAIPVFPFVERLMKLECRPGGTARNWSSYGHMVNLQEESQGFVLADPQTSGGLLISVGQAGQSEFEASLKAAGIEAHCIGQMAQGAPKVRIVSS